MKWTSKIVVISLLICFVIFSSNIVHATGFLSGIMNEANKFGSYKDTDNGIGSSISDFLKTSIIPLIDLIGNLVFAAVTVILGAKYILSGVEGKSDVKETLPIFITAVIFFYLANALTTYAWGVGKPLGQLTQYSNLAGQIIATVNVIVRYVAFGGIVAVGLKYMFESADGRAKIKERLVPLCLGMILVFTASNFVDYIIDVGKSVLN